MGNRIVSKSLMTAAFVALMAIGCSNTGTSGGASTSTTGPEGGNFGQEGNLPDGGGIAGGVETSGGGMRTIYFDFDAFSLRGNARDDLQHNAGVLKGRQGSKVEIQGNCDERGTEEYNLALGKKRAEAAKRYLIDLGVDSSRISTISFGEENPAVRGHSESAWGRNRRDDFVLR